MIEYSNNDTRRIKTEDEEREVLLVAMVCIVFEREVEVVDEVGVDGVGVDGVRGVRVGGVEVGVVEVGVLMKSSSVDGPAVDAV